MFSLQRPGCPPFNLINHEPLSDQPRQVGGDDDDDGDGDGDDDGDDDGGSGGGGGDGGSGGGSCSVVVVASKCDEVHPAGKADQREAGN